MWQEKILTIGATVLGSLIYSQAIIALEPETVLGEYWNDPLFGEAAAETVVQVELLHRLLWLQRVNLDVGKKVRFNVHNKTDELHVLALSPDPDQLAEDRRFRLFVSEEVAHADSNYGSANTQHEHTVSESDAALSLVRTLEQKPTVTVRPGEVKELIVRFVEPAQVYMRCVVDGHADLKHDSVINIGTF